LRYSFTFNLRTWIFRNPESAAIPLDRIGRIATQNFPDGELALQETGNVETQSANMFVLPVQGFDMNTWPKTGTATVNRSTRAPSEMTPGKNALALAVTGDTDSVELLERNILLDGSGNSIVSIALRYLASEAVDLEVFQKNPTTNVTQLAFKLTLPATNVWKNVHVFTLVKEPLFSVHIHGKTGNPISDVFLYGIEVRHINTKTLTTPSAVNVNVTDTEYIWSSLASRPFLVIGVVVSGGPDTLEVSNDFGFPTFTNSQVIASTVNVGAVALTQPRSSTIVAKINNTTVLASVVLMPYDSVYNGHDI
jgi:hypothetical protein